MFDRNKSKPASQPATEPASKQSPSTPATPATARIAAMIGPSIKIKGEVTGDENLLIEGSVEGTINLNEHEVSVGQSGNVAADIRAKTIKIDGAVTGDISGGEKVVITQSGNVRGNIVAPRVTLEDGAVFKGSIDMDPGDTATTKAPLTSQQSANSPAGDSKAPNLDLKSG